MTNSTQVYKKKNVERVINNSNEIHMTEIWAENETTRWEGVFELSPESDFMSYYSSDKKEDFKNVLTTSQKERLKIALLNTDSISYDDFGLVDLVYEGNENELDIFLINGLKTLKEEDFWFASNFMERLKHRNDSKDTKIVIEEYDKLQFEYNKEDELKKLIDRFIKLVE